MTHQLYSPRHLLCIHSSVAASRSFTSSRIFLVISIGCLLSFLPSPACRRLTTTISRRRFWSLPCHVFQVGSILAVLELLEDPGVGVDLMHAGLRVTAGAVPT